jgi:hypothetical protein
MRSIRLTLAILLLAGIATATSTYEPVAPGDFVTRAETYQGHLVSLSGEVCAINAEGKSFRLFDPDSKALIDVSLARLTPQQRRTLMNNPVRWASVEGQAVLVDGKLVVEAHHVAGRNR